LKFLKTSCPVSAFLLRRFPRLLQNSLTFQQFARKIAQYRLKNRFFY